MIVRELLIRLGVVGGRETEKTFYTIDNSVKRLDNSLANLNGILAGLFAGVSVAAFIKIADTMQGLRDQIGNATGDMQGAADMLDKLGEHATRGRVAVDEYASSWAKMHTGVKSFGGTTEDTTKFMDTLSAAFKSNGTPAETVSSALFQLGQSMQSGVIQGEEMNSLIDAQGELFNDLAVSIAGSVPAYKKLQEGGKVTSKMLLEAVNKQYDKYVDRLRLAPMKVGDAITVVGNKWKLFTDRMNRETKFVQKIANGIIAVFDKIETKSGELIKKFGGIERVLSTLGLILTSGGIVVGIYAIGAAIAFITSPFATLIAVISGLLLILDDFLVWRKGGDSMFRDMFGNYNETMKPVEDAVVGMLKKIDEHVGILKTSFTIFSAFVVGKWLSNMVKAFAGVRALMWGVKKTADAIDSSMGGGEPGKKGGGGGGKKGGRWSGLKGLFSPMGIAKGFMVNEALGAFDAATGLDKNTNQYTEGFDLVGSQLLMANSSSAKLAGLAALATSRLAKTDTFQTVSQGADSAYQWAFKESDIWLTNKLTQAVEGLSALYSANENAFQALKSGSAASVKPELKTIEYKPNITVQLTTPTNDPAGVESAVLSATEKTQRGFTEWLSNEIAFNTGAK